MESHELVSVDESRKHFPVINNKWFALSQSTKRITYRCVPDPPYNR